MDQKPQFPPVVRSHQHGNAPLMIIALAIAVAVGAFVVFGSMNESRNREVDGQRREAIQNLNNTLDKIEW